MQPKTLLVLALVVLGLGAFIFFYEKELPSTEERAELAKKVLAVDEQDVDSVEIEWDDQNVRLERQRSDVAEGAEDDGNEEDLGTAESTWRITAPMAGRADSLAVEGLVRSIVGLESNRELEDFDPADLGLDAPRARVTIQTADSQSILEVGSDVPASSDMLVALTGERIAHQVAASLFAELIREPGEWRDKKLFTGTRSDITAVTLEGAGGTVELADRDDDFWIASLDDRADESQVNTLMSELTSLRVRAFLDQTPLTTAGMGLDPATGTVRVTREDEPPFQLDLGGVIAGEEGTYYGRADGQLFEIETRLPDLLGLGVADWRSKAWSTLQVFEVESARVVDSEGTLELRRDGADWKRGEDRVAYSLVSDLLYPIAELQGEQILELAEALELGFDLENPAVSISFTHSEKGEEDVQGEERLSLSEAVDGRIAATTEGREAVLVVAEDQAEEIREQLRKLRQAEPLPDAEDDSKEDEESAE